MSDTSNTHHPPKLNQFMHPRNPYRTPPSFKELASLYPSFRQFCSYDLDGKVRLDFSQPRALAELAISLLRKDFGLEVELPPANLVPTIPLRLNYLLWLQDLVGLWVPKLKPTEFSLEKEIQIQEQLQQGADCDSIAPEKSKTSNKGPQYSRPVVGLDVGCGASCVYGLLGARHCNWSMVASDTELESLKVAKSNVTKNGLARTVHIAQGSADSLFGVVDQPDTISFLSGVRCTQEDEPMETETGTATDNDGYLADFSMCNPPFFSSEQDADSNSKTKKGREAPKNAPTGKLTEVVVEGGEVAFIQKMVEESVLYKDKIRVFSTLVGTAADLKLVKQIVASAKPCHSTVTEFCQGRTMRWGIAWTWCPSVPLEVVVSKKQMAGSKPIQMKWPRQGSALPSYTVQAAWEAIEAWLTAIKLKPKMFKTSKYYIGGNLKAYDATWQNQRRKRREEHKKNNTARSPSDCTSFTSEDSNFSDCSKRPLLEESNPLEPDSKRRKMAESADSGDSSDEEEETNEENNVAVKKKKGGKPCLLKVIIHVKMVNNVITVELNLLSGVLGKDGANQLLQYLKNKINKEASS